MFELIENEKLSPQAKALLILLRWAEKEGAPCKELHETNARSKDDRGENDNTKRSERENQGAFSLPTYAKAGS